MSSMAVCKSVFPNRGWQWWVILGSQRPVASSLFSRWCSSASVRTKSGPLKGSGEIQILKMKGGHPLQK